MAFNITNRGETVLIHEDTTTYSSTSSTWSLVKTYTHSGRDAIVMIWAEGVNTNIGQNSESYLAMDVGDGDIQISFTYRHGSNVARRFSYTGYAYDASYAQASGSPFFYIRDGESIKFYLGRNGGSGTAELTNIRILGTYVG